MLTVYRGPSALPSSSAPVVAVLAATGNGKLSAVGAVALTVYPDGDGGPLAALAAKRATRTAHGACPSDCPVQCYAEMTAVERVALGQPERLRSYLTGRDLPVSSPADAASWAAAVTLGARRPLLRLCAYGDSASLPAAVLTGLLDGAKALGLAVTAYTRGWRYSPHLQASHMASVATVAEQAEAAAMGWRTYRTRAWIRQPDGRMAPEPLLPGEIACPATAEGGRRTTCDRCRLCDGRGQAPGRANIAAIDHGPGRHHWLRAWLAAGEA